MVEPSPWPILLSFALFTLTIGAVMYIHNFNNGGLLLNLGFILTALGMTLWFRDVITESTLLGCHTKEVKKGLIIGFALFILSEVFAFLSVFWAFFHSSLAPTLEIGGIWPPVGITALDPFAIPLLNTLLLLSSGAFVTYGHHALIAGNRKAALVGTFITIILAVIFTSFQYYEYSEAAFSMSDGVYGSVFYASTGLHGLTLVAPNKINKSSVKIRKNQKNYYKIQSKVNVLSTVEQPLQFLEWLAGFVDGEGNFNISLRNYKENKYNSVVLTFQIALHIDDLEVLKFIQTNLRCGKISISGKKCNFFVNDQLSLINIIVPVFNIVKLKSSKYFQF